MPRISSSTSPYMPYVSQRPPYFSKKYSVKMAWNQKSFFSRADHSDVVKAKLESVLRLTSEYSLKKCTSTCLLTFLCVLTTYLLVNKSKECNETIVLQEMDLRKCILAFIPLATWNLRCHRSKTDTICNALLNASKSDVSKRYNF